MAYTDAEKEEARRAVGHLPPLSDETRALLAELGCPGYRRPLPRSDLDPTATDSHRARAVPNPRPSGLRIGASRERPPDATTPPPSYEREHGNQAIDRLIVRASQVADGAGLPAAMLWLARSAMEEGILIEQRRILQAIASP